MELDLDEALRYLDGRGGGDAALRTRCARVAERLTAALKPRFIYRVFPLERAEDGILLAGSGLLLTGSLAERMLADCGQAALLACTLGAEFDAMLRSEQARDMGDAALLDVCGSAWVEAGCGAAERELAARLPGKYLTDRFSPGYGDLPLALQPALLAALDAERRIGLHVEASLLMNPVKSVTAVIGISDRPQPARVRGCGACSMRETCAYRKGGRTCEL